MTVLDIQNTNTNTNFLDIQNTNTNLVGETTPETDTEVDFFDANQLHAADLEANPRRSFSALSYDEKTKRVLWSPAEIRMLKRGVEVCNTTVNKNMPWKKVLLLGKEVFHISRKPSDLKDKWKQMKREQRRHV